MSYQGFAATIPFGIEGLSGNENPSQIPVTQLTEARNVDYSDGPVRKENGATKYNATAIGGSPVILGGTDWWPDSGNQRMVVYTSAGELRKDSGAGTFPVTLTSGLSAGVVPVFVACGFESSGRARKLFVFNGVDGPTVITGDNDTTTALTSPPADWATSRPRTGVLHDNRVFGAGNNNDPHRLYVSTDTDHEDFTGTGSATFSVYPGEGDYIHGLQSFRRGVLLIWKWPQGVYVLDTSDSDINNWRPYRANQWVGSASPLAAVQVDDGRREADMVFIDRNGEVFSLTTSAQFLSLLATSLSEPDSMDAFVRREVGANRLLFAQGTYYPRRRQIHFAVTSKGSNQNNLRLILDLNRPGVVRWSVSDSKAYESLWIRTGPDNQSQLVGGGLDGFVWLLDTDDQWNQDGQAYESRVTIPATDFGYLDPRFANAKKNGARLYLTQGRRATGEVAVDIFWDGNYYTTLYTEPVGSGARLDIDFILGQARLGIGSVVVHQQKLTGSGWHFAARVRQAGLNEGMSLVNMKVFFTLGTDGVAI